MPFCPLLMSLWAGHSKVEVEDLALPLLVQKNSFKKSNKQPLVVGRDLDNCSGHNTNIFQCYLATLKIY